MPFVARGSGTGLAGGAVPLDGAVVIVTTKMNRVLSVDLDGRQAWVEPGVLNLDLTRQLAAHGLHFAPDPSSQQSCSIGGNVATNSGGPHCLADGVTGHARPGRRGRAARRHASPCSAAWTPSRPGSTCGACSSAARACSASPPASACASRRTRRRCARCSSTSTAVEDGAATVSAIIAAGIVPAALEMMDAPITRAVEAYVHAGFPTDAAAILIVEVDGLPGGGRGRRSSA